jgi:hypothetical protein
MNKIKLVKDKCLEKRFCQKHVHDINRHEYEFHSRPPRLPTTESDENVHKMRALEQNVRHLTVGIIEEPTINRKAARLLLMVNLGTKEVCANIVPQNLTNDPRQRRLEVFTTNRGG